MLYVRGGGSDDVGTDIGLAPVPGKSRIQVSICPPVVDGDMYLSGVVYESKLDPWGNLLPCLDKNRWVG